MDPASRNRLLQSSGGGRFREGCAALHLVGLDTSSLGAHSAPPVSTCYKGHQHGTQQGAGPICTSPMQNLSCTISLHEYLEAASCRRTLFRLKLKSTSLRSSVRALIIAYLEIPEALSLTASSALTSPYLGLISGRSTSAGGLPNTSQVARCLRRATLRRCRSRSVDCGPHGHGETPCCRAQGTTL